MCDVLTEAGTAFCAILTEVVGTPLFDIVTGRYRLV